ncbi:MAG TPA: ABC transporter ATP-binding protein [Terriglobales bacterium]|jgi:ABC-2 type transport system ATP-binding protein|nr:ABC transporter ATP-binding protein [Terriglobales bacterium]
MSTDLVIETRELSKRYGDASVVCDLNLKVQRGQITGFLGRNGAGKSTTIKMLLGIAFPSSGSGTVLGRAIQNAKQSRHMRAEVAYVAEDKQLYSYMTVEQLIRFTRSFYRDWRTDTEQRLLRQFELPKQRKVKVLSKGMRTKLALLLALARRPQLLILDEPSEGLDPVGIEEFLSELVAAASEGITVFFSSHQIAEVERIADQACIIDRGELRVSVSMDDLRQDYRRVTVGFTGDPPRGAFRLPGISHISTAGRQTVFLAQGNADAVVEKAHALCAASVDVDCVSLRELFLHTVTAKENSDALV